MATHNADIQVNVYGESQSVDVKSFGRIVWATEAVEAGWGSDLYRIYESSNDIDQDADLSTATKAAGAAYFSQPNRPPDLAIAKVTYESVGGELGTSLSALKAAWDDWYGLAIGSRADADVEALSVWTEANLKLASQQSSTAAIPLGTGGNSFETLHAAAYTRSFGSWHPTDSDYVDLTWLAGILSANPDEQSGVAHSRKLVGPTAATPTELAPAGATQVKAYNGNLYLPFYGPSVMRDGVVWSGKTIEDKILEDWVQARLQEAVAAMVIRESEANGKVDFDDFGIGLVEGEIRGVIGIGTGVGHFVAGTLICTPPKYETLTAAQIASRTVVIPLTVRKKVGLKDFTLNVGVTF